MPLTKDEQRELWSSTLPNRMAYMKAYSIDAKLDKDNKNLLCMLTEVMPWAMYSAKFMLLQMTDQKHKKELTKKLIELCTRFQEIQDYLKMKP